MTAGIEIIEVACPQCGATNPQLLLDALLDVEDRVEGRYAISRCVQCRLVYLSRRPTVESLPQCYTPNYHVQDPVRRSAIPEYLYGLRLKSRTRRLLVAVGKNCRAVLEIGCGDGSFLRYLDRVLPATTVLTGIDLQVQPTGDSGRLRLIQGEFEKVEFPARYDAVVMFNVLEHLADPLNSLRKIGTRIQPGGIVFGEVPNWDSTWRKVFPRHWQGLQIPRHMTEFEPPTLKAMFEAAGYEVVFVRNLYDPGDLSVTLCNWITDKLTLATPPRRAWFYFPVVLAAAPVVWLVNLVTGKAGAIEFAARKR